jgi:excisionase family DNA binding protein
MAQLANLYTADEVAQLLSLHVKTVRRYLREGRLKAKRIGKEYRIAPADLDKFAGTTLAIDKPRHVLVSSIVDVDVVRPEESHRVTTMIMAALKSRTGQADLPRVDTIYYEDRAKLRITISANLVLTCELLRMIDALLEDRRG